MSSLQVFGAPYPQHYHTLMEQIGDYVLNVVLLSRDVTVSSILQYCGDSEKS